MKRRGFFKRSGAVIALIALGAFGSGMASSVLAQDNPTMITVVKIVGVPYFSLLKDGLEEVGKELGINSTMVGPTTVDPAQQVRLVEDAIASGVDVLGLIPLDVNVLAPVVKRAREAGIIVITQEGPDMEGRTWDLEMVENVKFGETMMESLAQQMGGEGGYIGIVGTLTTPLHNLWADAAFAYQKKKYPKMELLADRYPGADQIDTSEQVTRDAIQAYPNLRGVIGFGSNGPIGAGNAVRQRRLQDRIAVTGWTLPSQAKPLIDAGVLKETFCWSPKEVGEALVAVASLALKDAKFFDGMDIPGIGAATVDVENRLIMVDRAIRVNAQTVDELVAMGI